MKKHRTLKKDIPAKIAEAKRLIAADGLTVQQAVEKVGISLPTYYNHRGGKSTGGMRSSNVDKALQQLVEAIRQDIIAKLQ